MGDGGEWSHLYSMWEIRAWCPVPDFSFLLRQAAAMPQGTGFLPPCGDLDSVLGSWLWHDPVPVIEEMWGRAVSLLPFLHLYVYSKFLSCIPTYLTFILCIVGKFLNFFSDFSVLKICSIPHLLSFIFWSYQDSEIHTSLPCLYIKSAINWTLSLAVPWAHLYSFLPQRNPIFSDWGLAPLYVWLNSF